MTATMEGDPTLAIPGHFELEEEDSEDYLYPEEESEQAGEQEQNEGALTGNIQPKEDAATHKQSPPY